MISHDLIDFLLLAVPLRISEIGRDIGPEDIGGLVDHAKSVVDSIANGGDTILFRTPETGTSVRALIRALAILAVAAPGGVTFGGAHFCALPPCPMCPSPGFRQEVTAMKGALR